MARPGRPPGTITDLDDKLSSGGEILETEGPKRQKAKKEPDAYIFEMVGDFLKDPENGTTRYPVYSHPTSQLVHDEEMGISRMARLIRGHQSIWVDEQKDLDERYANRNRPNLVFVNGQLIVPASEKNTLKYLMSCSDFEGCKHPATMRKKRYKLIDTEAEEAARLQLEKKIKDAYDKAWETPMEELIPHAKFLGISMTNHKGLEKTPDALRADYVDKARGKGLRSDREVSDAVDLFLRTYKNPKVKMYGLVRTAFEKDMIVFVDGQAIWNDTKAMICQVPEGKNVADYLSELMLTKDGAELRERLENI